MWIAALIVTILGSILYLIFRNKEDEDNLIIIGKVFIGIGIVLLVVSCFTLVKSGHVGVKVLFGKVNTDSYISEGLHFVNPFYSIKKMSIRTEMYTMSAISSEGEQEGDDSIVALSKDGLKLPLDLTIAYNLIPQDAPVIYRYFGDNYRDAIIRPAGRTSIREATARVTAQEAYSTKREEVPVSTQEILDKRISDLLKKRGIEGQGISISQVMLRNVGIPDKVKNAIEEKLSEEQRAEKMKFTILFEKQEAERKEIEAKGISKFQQIVTEGISKELLQWKGIEATLKLSESLNTKVVIIGGADGLPVILNTAKE